MTNEVRFRVWDIKNKSWMSMCNVVMALTGKEFYWNFGYESLKDIPFKEIKISQYTNVKDKNGKDIYEGDIVICSMIYCKTKIEHRGIVVFEKGSFIVGSDTMVDKYITFIELFNEWDVEIVGNIYERGE